MSDKLQRTDPIKHPHVYAEAGIWFDALKSFEQTIEAAPDEGELLIERIQLFKQVGLDKVVELEHARLN